MAAYTLPATADPSQVTVKVFDYSKGGVAPEEFVVPLNGLSLAGSGTIGTAGATRGESVLVGGTVTVPKTLVTATSTIMLTRRVLGGTVGNLSFTRSAGVSFTINSTSATETSTVEWLIIP